MVFLEHLMECGISIAVRTAHILGGNSRDPNRVCTNCRADLDNQLFDQDLGAIRNVLPNARSYLLRPTRPRSAMGNFRSFSNSGGQRAHCATNGGSRRSDNQVKHLSTTAGRVRLWLPADSLECMSVRWMPRVIYRYNAWHAPE